MSVAANMPARNVKGNVQAQDKILYVANKLGLSSLKYMQATTRVSLRSVSNGSNAAHTF
jgi:hypothetical protein